MAITLTVFQACMFLNTLGKIWVILKLGNRFLTAIPPFITAIFWHSPRYLAGANAIEF
jgi:hypothetical protein